MDWRDIGFVMTARRHGETALIAELLTEAHGRRAGLVRGGQSPKKRALLQPGNLVSVSWRGRLPEHLGAFEVELLRPHAAGLIDDPDRLAALVSAAALIALTLPEHEPHADVFDGFGKLVAGFDSADWPARYVIWECALLTALGFGLDLKSCAATGVNDDLAYVSPKTGRAVSRSAGQPYHDKLLPLPDFLWRDAPAGPLDVVAGLTLTGFFLHHHVLAPQGRKLPEVRNRFIDRVYRLTGPAAPDMIGS